DGDQLPRRANAVLDPGKTQAGSAAHIKHGLARPKSERGRRSLPVLVEVAGVVIVASGVPVVTGSRAGRDLRPEISNRQDRLHNQKPGTDVSVMAGRSGDGSTHTTRSTMRAVGITWQQHVSQPASGVASPALRD